MYTKSRLIRQLQLLTPLILASLLLASCGQSTGNTTPGPTSNPTQTPTQPANPTATTVPTSQVVANPTATAAQTTQPTANSTATMGPTSQTFNPGELDKYVSQLMATYDIPGAAVGLVQNGKVIYAKGYGVRDTTTKKTVSENTLFPIGSITKSFTALAIMHLVDQGKLDLDAPVIKYLPEFKLANPEATSKVTVRQLLVMSTGLIRSDGEIMQNKSRQQVLSNLPNIPLAAKPGELWQYSNQSYTVAGLVLERVSGKSWEDYIRQNILAPLGMKTANLDIASLQKATEYVRPHTLDVLKGVQPSAFTDLTGFAPAGAVNSSVTEMTNYLRFQLGDGTLENGERLLTSKSFEQMHTQQIKIQGEEGYGLGWITRQYRGNKIFTHNGGIAGFYADSALLPGAKAGVIILTISPEGITGTLFASALIARALDGFLGLPAEPNLLETLNKQAGFDPIQRKANLEAVRSYKADPATFAPLLGEYNGSLGHMIVSTKDSKLNVEVTTGEVQGNYELVPFKLNGFLGNNSGANGQVFEFKAEQNGTITLTQQGLPIAQKLGANVKNSEYKDPKGRFSISVPAELMVQAQGEIAQIQSSNPPGVFILTAFDSTEDVTAATKKFLTQLDPGFNLSPVDTQPIPVEKRTWTQFIYQLPGDQLLAVMATQQKNTTYLLLAQGKTADVPALTPILITLLTNFKIDD